MQFTPMPQGCFSRNQYIFSSQQTDLSWSLPKCLAVSGDLAGNQIKLLNLDRTAKGTLLTTLFPLRANTRQTENEEHYSLDRNLKSSRYIELTTD